MSLSRSTFYVDPPTQRHSMFIDPSDLEAKSKPLSGSSSTLPSGSSESLKKKKSSKGLFGRSLFASTSLSSLTKKSKKKKDSFCQTTEREPGLDVGVQTQNASTTDVPVQTSGEWAGDDGYSYRDARNDLLRARYSSPLLRLRDPVLAPLVSSRVLKYSAPVLQHAKISNDKVLGDDGDKYAGNLSVKQVSYEKENIAGLIEQTSKHAVSPVKSSGFTNEKSINQPELTANKTIPEAENISVVVEVHPIPPKSSGTDDEKKTASAGKEQTECVVSAGETSSSLEAEDLKRLQSSVVSESSPSTNITERPLSALKIERTDSPVKKSVHFVDYEPDFKKCGTNITSTSVCSLPAAIKTKTEIDVIPKVEVSSLPRNVDEEFLALLRNLDIITDDPALNKIETPVFSPGPTIFFPCPVSCLNEQPNYFLAPIPETTSESDANVNEPTDEKDDVPNDPKVSTSPETINTEGDSESPPHPEKHDIEVKIKNYTDKSADITTQTEIVISKLDVDSNINDSRENVYDNVPKEGFAVNTELPTLPSFFERAPKYTEHFPATSSYSVEDTPSELGEKTSSHDTESDSIVPTSVFQEFPEEQSADAMILSRSSSRSSLRSNPTVEFEELLDSAKRFDSCENIDELEDEILKSLCHSDDNNDLDEIIGVTEFVPSTTIPTSEAVQQRSDVADRLICGKEEEPTAANQSKSDTPKKRFHAKRGKKYVATLTKMEHHSNDELDERTDSPASSVDSSSNYSIKSVQSDDANVSDKKETNISCRDTLKQSTTAASTMPTLPSTNTPLIPPPSSLNTSNTSGKNAAPEDKPCDFTHCLRPSQLRNTPFLTKMNSANVVLRPTEKTSGLEPKHNQSVTTETKKTNPVGQCDFGNCLKPSQVQNSVFTAELSEITAIKSSSFGHEGNRGPSPLPPISRSPVPNKSTDAYNRAKDKIGNLRGNQANQQDNTTHKSEFTITLQPLQSGGASESRPILPRPPVESVIFNQRKSDIVENENLNTVMPTPENIPPPPPLPPKKAFVLENRGEDFSKSNTTELNSCGTPQSLSSNENHHCPEDNLERKNSLEQSINDQIEDCGNSDSGSIVPLGRSYENRVKGSERMSSTTTNVYQNGNHAYNFSNGEIRHSPPRSSSLSPKAVIRHDPPPPGAVLVDQKVTVEGDHVHTDKYYALPVKEYLKETTATTKFIPAPPKYEGIGPTEDGIPIGLRNSVKEENKHNWYRTMFKSLHRAELSNEGQEYVIGYTSEPETSKKDKARLKKSATLDHRQGGSTTKIKDSMYNDGYPASAKSSINIYSIQPRKIEDYEPGDSSVTDNEITTGSKRFLPSSNTPKTSYEFKNGYEPENHFIRNLDQPDALSVDQQRVYYKEIQRGGEVPQFGLGKPAPQRPKEPTIGPLPLPPLNYNGPVSPQEGRPLSLPENYCSPYENGNFQTSNGLYEIQLKQSKHSEYHQRISPSLSQVSPPHRMKSPSRSPDLKIPARALFDFKAESPKEISFKKGDFVLVLRQLDKNWYEGEHQGKIGIFPVNYIEIIPPEHSTPIKSYSEGVGKMLFSFTAKTSVELSAKKGETITLLQRVDSNWYEARLNNIRGIVPVSYIQILQEPTEMYSRSRSPTHDRCRSRSVERQTSPERTSLKTSLNDLNNSSSQNFNYKGKPLTRSTKGSGLIEPVLYKALYNYTPIHSDELELEEGDSVYIVEMCDDGWYVGTSVRTGVFGIFPGNYVQKV